MALRPWRRHSLVLAVAGACYFLVGFVYVTVPVTDERLGAIAFAIRLAPLPVWGVVWMTAGILCFASTRWPPANETWGYTVLASTSALWSTIYALSMLFFDAPATGITGVAVWALFGFMWWAISGLRNPDDVPKGV